MSEKKAATKTSKPSTDTATVKFRTKQRARVLVAEEDKVRFSYWHFAAGKTQANIPLDDANKLAESNAADIISIP